MRKGSLQYKILLVLMAGVGLGLSGNPRTHYRIYRELARELGGRDEFDEWSEDSVRRSLYHIKDNEYVRKKIIKKGKNDFLITFELTPKGKEVLRTQQKSATINSLRIAAPRAWDGKWRFVVFDIPEKYRVARNIFRDRLKRMGFFRIQQSIWIYPFPCKQEIQLLADYFSLTQSVFIFEDAMMHDEKLRQYFARQGIYLRNSP